MTSQMQFNGYNGVNFNVTDVSKIKPELKRELLARFRMCGYVDEDVLMEQFPEEENWEELIKKVEKTFPTELISLDWANLKDFVQNLRNVADSLEKYVDNENALISVDVD